MYDTKEISRKEAREIGFWSASETESPQSNSIHNIVMKAAEAQVFLEKLAAFDDKFRRAGAILELGGGQCWASCIVKRLFPSARVVATDIAPDAVASVRKWEHIYEVKLDEVTACRSYEVPFLDGSFNLIFAYAAAHHFVRHKKTLREIKRLLAPSGVALFLHEPGCRRYIYPLAFHRVNRKRPAVPEDVLIYTELSRLARQTGLRPEIRFSTTLTNRSPMAMMYYFALGKLPWLRGVLPCSFDMTFYQEGGPGAAGETRV